MCAGANSQVHLRLSRERGHDKKVHARLRATQVFLDSDVRSADLPLPPLVAPTGVTWSWPGGGCRGATCNVPGSPGTWAGGCRSATYPVVLVATFSRGRAIDEHAWDVHLWKHVRSEMAKICRVLEKLRQLRTDQLRKSGSLRVHASLLRYQRFEGYLERSRCQIGKTENIDICFTFQGGCRPAPGSADPRKTTKQAISLLHSPALSLYNRPNWMNWATWEVFGWKCDLFS